MSAGISQIRILAVDDHPVVRQGIAGLVGIQADMVLVCEASNGREAIQQFRTQTRLRKQVCWSDAYVRLSS